MGKTTYRELKDVLQILDINPKEFWEIANRVEGWFPDLPERTAEVNERKVRLILRGEK